MLELFVTIGKKIEKIEKGCAQWDNYLLLLTIMDYCFAPTVSEKGAAYLRMTIDEHHKCFTQLYPSIFSINSQGSLFSALPGDNVQVSKTNQLIIFIVTKTYLGL